MFDIYDEITELLGKNLDNMTIRYNNLTVDENRELTIAEQRDVRNLEKFIKNNTIVIGNIEARIQPIATCEMLIGLYTSQFEENKANEAWLAKTSTLLQNKECMNAPIYLKIAEAYYALNPNARAAQAIARMAYNKKDYSKAAKFFREAAESASSPADQARNYLRLAQTLSNQGIKSGARTAAQQALKIDPRMGNAYLLIGNLYSSSANDCGNNEFEKRAVHFAALEMYRKARSVDPNVASTANQAINSSSALAPDKQLIFQMGMAGKQYKIECWIQTTVSIPNL